MLLALPAVFGLACGLLARRLWLSGGLLGLLAAGLVLLFWPGAAPEADPQVIWGALPAGAAGVMMMIGAAFGAALAGYILGAVLRWVGLRMRRDARE